MLSKVSKCKRSYSGDGDSVNFAFADGRVLNLRLSEIPEGIHPWLALRGLSENISNSFANAKTVEECFEAASAMADTFRKGLRTERVPSEREDPAETLAEAYSRFRVANGAAEPDREKLLQRLSAMSKSDRDTLRRTPAIAALLAEIRGEKHPVTKSPDELIGELG